ncbi:endonuclease/exonuclease/phosphatase family protein [Pontibacter ramchanderi]|uniref:Endonuclease/exonuclease/phosphatase family metal-dependent hydrolase n=1 Tax=Pontibacter ramchanderi TaxID=1179743 RepID=A0A2N3V0V5_9BACT|nr:endonuclease/exonuclease/phosphatase family protein [Pontibacter ramchanderi]PKV75264.1 endonuclease/exonuclease/phosphatase family metal-dependent hydrolase [Pontibacter ramchanderi]
MRFSKLSLLYAIGLFCLTACASSSVQGIDEDNESAITPTQLRVMSYNIHHANPPGSKGVIDLDAIAQVIRNEQADLVALQEVDVHIDRSGNVHQAKALATMLGMHYYFAKAIDFGGGEYGVAILSRFPLTDTLKVTLPREEDPRAEGRVLAIATVKLPGGVRIKFGSTHLDILGSANRRQQVQTINAIAAADKPPFVLAGDLNDYPESPAIAELDQVFQRTCLVDCEPTFPQDKPDRIIDYIAFTRSSNLKVLAHKVVPENYASDHRPVVAVLEFASAPNAVTR